MKKIYLSGITILMAIIVSVSFTSCGGDDDDDNKDSTPVVNPSNSENGGSASGDNSSNSVFQVQTGNVSDITDNSAILSGSFTTSNGLPDIIGFFIGTSSNLTDKNRDRDLAIFDISSPFSATVNNLHSQTTYYYRAYAYIKASNSYFLGDIRSFDTNGGNGNNGNPSAAKGSGTLDNPYNVAAIKELASKLQVGEIDATDYYFKGIISQITDQFGVSIRERTATFYISDGEGTSQFLCDHVMYLHSDGYCRDIAIGDEVVICGKITKDCTSSGRAFVYSMNGNTGTTEALEYSIGGRTFHTVLVEGGPMKPFYIMQTEIPIKADITINNRVVRYPDSIGDGYLNRHEFCVFLLNLRELTGYLFRLATTEEWQYAARGGNKSKGYTYCGGNTVDDVAWYSGNSNKQAHDVAQKQPNELGLYDMSGNYAEICNDTDEEFYVDGPECGGSWKDDASGCTVSSWKEGSTKGKMPNGITNALFFDGSYITLRLVYTKW